MNRGMNESMPVLIFSDQKLKIGAGIEVENGWNRSMNAAFPFTILQDSVKENRLSSHWGVLNMSSHLLRRRNLLCLNFYGEYHHYSDKWATRFI